jgi:hypothetical protein
MTTARKPTRAKALGVTDTEYARRLAEQDGHCAICPSTPKVRRLHVDHDHATGEVRGLLCHRCNRALPSWVTPGWLLDAAAYLHPGGSGDAVSPWQNTRTLRLFRYTAGAS